MTDMFLDTPDADRIKELEAAIRALKREKLELSRVYEERGRQIERLETALVRATEGTR